MDRGYVKLWRKSLDHPLYKKPLIWHFWGYCLKKASHKDTEYFLNGQIIEVKKGSFVFGRKKASQETGLTERQIRTAIKHLEKLQNLTIKTTNRFSIISIMNWHIYQQPENKNDQQNDHRATSQRPTNDHIQEGKELKNIPPSPPKGKIDELKDYLLENIPQDMQAHVLKITEFYQYRKQKPKAKRYDTKKKVSGLFRDLSNCMAAGYDISACMDIAMERGWMTPSVDYFKPEMFLATKLNGKSQKSKEEILKQAGFSS